MGVEGCLPVAYLGFRVKGSMKNWSSCELEAYTQDFTSRNPVECKLDR